MNDASHNHGEQENTVSTYSVDVETLQQIALTVSYTHLTLPTKLEV